MQHAMLRVKTLVAECCCIAVCEMQEVDVEVEANEVGIMSIDVLGAMRKTMFRPNLKSLNRSTHAPR